MKDLLNELNSTIEALEASQKEYLLPDTGDPETVIQGYLSQQQAQRQLNDLKALRDTVQGKLEKIEAARLAEQQRQEAEERARFVAAETARITGE